MSQIKLGVVGVGNMASAILNGILTQKMFAPCAVLLSNPHVEKLEHFRSLGVQVTCDNSQVARQADILLLAVKPQKFEEVLPALRPHIAGKCVVSIAAGISCAYLKEMLPGANVIRVMPNTPLQVGMGATAIARAPEVAAQTFQTVCDIFSAAGRIALIDEAQMDAIIPVSGSSPAFFFRMADVMTRWAVAQGLDEETALTMTAAAMRGSAEMLLYAGKSAHELTVQVCSPGGTTLAALSAFDDRDFDGMLQDAMDRCAKRSAELGK